MNTLNKNDLTVLYYTSNKENEKFEAKIRKKLLEVCGDIPIISVSQKPIDLGKNICVGDVGASYLNLHRQIQIGCQEAKTPFVVAAEADCLYPPDYFGFRPTNLDTCYLYDNIYILKSWTDGFLNKDICFGALIAGREFYLKKLEKSLLGKPMWGPEKNNRLWERSDWKFFGTENPVISFKTGRGIMKATKTFGDPVDEVPYWGKSSTLRKEFFA